MYTFSTIDIVWADTLLTDLNFAGVEVVQEHSVHLKVTSGGECALESFWGTSVAMAPQGKRNRQLKATVGGTYVDFNMKHILYFTVIAYIFFKYRIQNMVV